MAGAVPLQRQGHPAPAVGIARHFHRVTPEGGDGGHSFQNGQFPLRPRRVETALRPLNVVHGPAQILSREHQPEPVPGLQQNTLGQHQALAHRPVSRLTEVAPLGVLEVGPPCNEGDFYVGQGRAGEDPQMLLFFQVGENQPLPVPIQHLLPAVGVKLHPAAPGQRFQLQMHFGVVAEGLVMAHALHRLGDGFLIQYTALAELHRKVKPPFQQALEDFQLDLPHELNVDLAQGLVPDHMELGFLLFQPVEGRQGRVDVRPLGQNHLIIQHRLQHRQFAVPLGPQPLAGPALGQAGDGADPAGAHFLRQGILGPGVEPELVCLFGPGLAPGLAGEEGFHFQGTAGHPKPGQPGPLVVLGDLEHLGAESLPGRGRAGVVFQPRQKRIHPFQLKGRAEPAGEHMPPGDGGDDLLPADFPLFQVAGHQVLIAEGQGLVPGSRIGAEIHKALPQAPAQPGQKGFFALVGQVHLINK